MSSEEDNTFEPRAGYGNPPAQSRFRTRIEAPARAVVAEARRDPRKLKLLPQRLAERDAKKFPQKFPH